MSRGKPALLSKEYKDRQRQEKKLAGEESFRTNLPLPQKPPVQLDGMAEGQRAWRSILRVHSRLPADLLSILDKQFLINYCVAVQLHHDAVDLVEEMNQRFSDGTGTLDDVLHARVELRMVLRLMLDYSKQLFANPRSRGGTNPPTKELTPEEVVERELKDLDKLLGESK